MKTKDELNTIKEEVETLNKKLAELTDDELKQVTGGFNPRVDQLLTSGIERGQSAGTSYLVTDENNLVDYEIYRF